MGITQRPPIPRLIRARNKLARGDPVRDDHIATARAAGTFLGTRRASARLTVTQALRSTKRYEETEAWRGYAPCPNSQSCRQAGLDLNPGQPGLLISLDHCRFVRSHKKRCSATPCTLQPASPSGVAPTERPFETSSITRKRTIQTSRVLHTLIWVHVSVCLAPCTCTSGQVGGGSSV